MKKYYLISIFLCCIINSYCQTNFSGDWDWENATSGFSIRISQINNTITGTHCATADNGNFIDCALKEFSGNSINGTVQGDSILVTFKSAYCGKQGTAVIKRINSTQIQWRITKKPDGVSYIPENAVMDLDSSPTVGGITLKPGYYNITSGITNYGTYASFYLVYVPISTMEVDVSYLVANISEGCRPSVQQNITFFGDKTWEITINPNGDIYFKILCCSGLSGGVGFGTLSYPL